MSAPEKVGTSLSSSLASPTSIASGTHQTEIQEVAIVDADSADAKSDVKNDTIIKGMDCG